MLVADVLCRGGQDVGEWGSRGCRVTFQEALTLDEDLVDKHTVVVQT
ncbi:hypothetical protein [Streptomyces sp. NEAU-YJ-81]|nr:hypothetical protein [Streptomyces sp. NEAU-YJ-81]MBO3681686.1 hypothetical protein [Streptomyces sp. NEAU-YJ-81]